MHQNRWVEEQIRVMTSLEGRTVVAWRGVEMAFAGGENEEPAVFADPTVPCLQLLRLEVALDSGDTRQFSTYQNDDDWGLCQTVNTAPIATQISSGIYRYVERLDLPVGVITEVKVWVSSSGDLAEVALDIDSRELLLVAGEVYEDWARPLRVGWMDESVLVFTSAQAADEINWMSPRQPIRYAIS